MKKLNVLILSAALMSPVAALSGCAMLDGLVGIHDEQAIDADSGKLIYERPDGELTLDAKDPETGIPNKPHVIRVGNPEQITGMAGKLLTLLGPWGALAGAVLGAAAGVYVKIRTGAANAKTVAAESAAGFLIMMIEKIKTGAADVFSEGKLDQDKLKEWLRSQGKEFSDPVYLAQMVEKITKGL